MDIKDSYIIIAFDELKDQHSPKISVPDDTIRPVPDDTIRPVPDDTIRPVPDDTIRPMPDDTIRPMSNNTRTARPRLVIKPRHMPIIRKHPMQVPKKMISFKRIFSTQNIILTIIFGLIAVNHKRISKVIYQ
jgi:hypothetical protein